MKRFIAVLALAGFAAATLAACASKSVPTAAAVAPAKVKAAAVK